MWSEIKRRMICNVYTLVHGQRISLESDHGDGIDNYTVCEYDNDRKNFIKYRYLWLYLFEIAMTILQCVDMYMTMYIWIGIE